MNRFHLTNAEGPCADAAERPTVAAVSAALQAARPGRTPPRGREAAEASLAMSL